MFSIVTDAVRRWSEKARAGARRIRAVTPELIRDATLIIERDLRNVALNGGRAQRVGLFMSAPARTALGVRSGVSAASIRSEVFKDGNRYVGVVGTPVKSVLWNEEGATVRPRRARALAIPTVNAQSLSGDVANRFAGLIGGGGRAEGASIRNAVDEEGNPLFVYRGRGQRAGGLGERAWLAGRRAGRLVLYFLLATVAHISARFMFRNSRRRVEPEVVARTGARLRVETVRALLGGAVA